MKTNTKHWASITAGIVSLAGYTSAASLGSEKYTYDVSGNIIEKSIDGKVTKMTFDQSNRLIEKQSHEQSKNSLSYDEAGHPIAEKSQNGQELRSMIYGYGGKVLETNDQGRKARLYYNAEGQLIGKSNNGMTSAYSWDGNVLAANDSEAFTNEAHVTGGVPVIAGDLAVVVSDYLGSTLSQGNSSLLSSAYGEGLEDGFFTGKPFVQELGAFVFKNRNYSIEHMRWTVPDPSGYPDGKNPFLYVNNDPANLIDPLGLEQISLTSHWARTVEGVAYQGDAAAVYNYTWEMKDGHRRLKTSAFVGDPAYIGHTGYTEYQSGAVNVYDVNPVDGTNDTVQTTRTVHGEFKPAKADGSGIFVREKTELGVLYKQDVVQPSLWINNPQSLTSGYNKPDLTYVVVNGPTTSTVMLGLDFEKDYGSWVEQ